ncbi:hypothetical protein VTN02DRAFT_6333 [Thermoascus thermophilus]
MPDPIPDTFSVSACLTLRWAALGWTVKREWRNPPGSVGSCKGRKKKANKKEKENERVGCRSDLGLYLDLNEVACFVCCIPYLLD